jgi:hypothetical protein
MNLRSSVYVFVVLSTLANGCNRGENGGGGLFASRTPTLQFAKESDGGCANVVLYKSTADQREFLWVSADTKTLNIPALGSKEFDLANPPEGLLVKIDLWASAPKHTPYCNCVSDNATRDSRWNAKSGKVTITLHDFVDPEGPMRRYKASAKFENVVFENDAGGKTTLQSETITQVLVGWFAG